MCREAQRKLYKVLSQYTFAIVTRKTTVPDPGKPYYFTDAMTLHLDPTIPSKPLWVKSRGRKELTLGPARLDDRLTVLPREAGILVGQLTAETLHTQQQAQQHTQQEQARPTKRRRVAARRQFRWWAAGAEPLWALFTLVVKGSTQTEAELRTVLRTAAGFDDLWVIARIVLFDNIECLALALQGKETLKLHTTPVQFAVELAQLLQHEPIFTSFQSYVPPPPPLAPRPARPPPPTRPHPKFLTSLPPPPPTYQHFGPYSDEPPYEKVTELLASLGDLQSMQSMQQQHEAQVSDELMTFLSTPTTPQYSPRSPPYVPSSPPYVPSSPPYVPLSPPYVSTSPLHYTGAYDPEYPAQQVQRMLYRPSSPTYA